MKTDIQGYGRKRPQLNIPIDQLNLDSENPRLAEEYKGGSQTDLLSALFEQFDLEEIAYSMSENGYFDEEPIVVIPNNLPEKFTPDKFEGDIEELQKELQKLTNSGELTFTVVEGNRRTATVKLLTDDKLRSKLKIKSNFPLPANAQVTDDLKVIPAIFYQDRKGISAYLGVRHIAGLLKWEAYAKAVFLAHRIEEGVANGKTILDSIKEVQKQTADRSDVIKKQYLCYKVLMTASEELSFDVEKIKDRFSLLTVSLNSPSIRNYLGIKNHKEINFEDRIVPIAKLGNLENVLTWIFGNGKDKTPLITDSRKITSHLAPILNEQESLEYLLKYNSIEEAYERSGGEETFLKKKLNEAKRNLSTALSLAYKYKNSEVSLLVEQCQEVVYELKKMLS